MFGAKDAAIAVGALGMLLCWGGIYNKERCGARFGVSVQQCLFFWQTRHHYGWGLLFMVRDMSQEGVSCVKMDEHWSQERMQLISQSDSSARDCRVKLRLLIRLYMRYAVATINRAQDFLRREFRFPGLQDLVDALEKKSLDKVPH